MKREDIIDLKKYLSKGKFLKVAFWIITLLNF